MLERYLLLAALLSIIGSCATAPVQPDSNAVIIRNVPFYAQEEYQCGPASLAGVLNYWNISATPEEIAKDIYSGSARGTLNLDMLFYAQRKGADALHYSGGWDDLREKINKGYPLIVMVDNGFSIYQVHHFMVAVGYSEGSVIVNSGAAERAVIDKGRFLTTWKKTNYWTLWIKKNTESRSQNPEARIEK
ncbi:MAG: C39 family peptidase [Nitrospirota bacterium]